MYLRWKKEHWDQTPAPFRRVLLASVCPLGPPRTRVISLKLVTILTPAVPSWHRDNVVCGDGCGNLCVREERPGHDGSAVTLQICHADLRSEALFHSESIVASAAQAVVTPTLPWFHSF